MTNEIVVIVEPPPEVDVEVSETGMIGPRGPEGPIGPIGPEGPKGDDGTVVGGVSPVVFQEHVDSPEPHPVYDDGPDLILLYQNAKV